MPKNEKPAKIARTSRGRPREFDRGQALCKALELFWEQGYMQTTMVRLCEVMGIKSPSLYCAFGCKADLFLEAISYYKRVYWHDAFSNFLHCDNLLEGTKTLFEETARILLLPNAPCGCLTVFSALTLPTCEERILEKINEMRQETKNVFQNRLQRAVEEGEIHENVNLPAVAGALVNFFEGLTLQAREKDMTLNKLRPIAMQGVRLLPHACCQCGNAAG